MIDRDTFLDICDREAFTNPRTDHYDVTPLRAHPLAYPFRTEDGEAIPAVVLQFAVENRHDARARRVISLSRSALGYSVWCGDRFTEGRLNDELDTEDLIESGLLQVPAWTAEQAFTEMHAVEGAYPFWAQCHFWKAWHSHQGLCKHVAAALQFVESNHDEGVDSVLDVLDRAYQALMEPTIHIDILLDDIGDKLPEADDTAKLRARGELLALVAGVAAPAGGLSAEQHERLLELLDVVASDARR